MKLNFKKVNEVSQPRQGAGYPDGVEVCTTYSVNDAQGKPVLVDEKPITVSVQGTNFLNDEAIKAAVTEKAMAKIAAGAAEKKTVKAAPESMVVDTSELVMPGMPLKMEMPK